VKPRLSVILALLAVGLAARLIPYVLAQFGMALEPGNTTYPWNFSPFLPICLFGGAMFARTRTAYLVPFAAWLSATSASGRCRDVRTGPSTRTSR